MNDISVDIAHSTVTIAGRRWPAVCLLCPQWETEPETDWNRTLGDTVPSKIGGSWEVFVPLENGLLVEVTVNVNPRSRLNVALYVAACYLDARDFGSADPPIWLPLAAGMVGKDVVIGTGSMRDRQSRWIGADPEWINELIDRLASKHVPMADMSNPRAKLISLSESARLTHLLHEEQASR